MQDYFGTESCSCPYCASRFSVVKRQPAAPRTTRKLATVLSNSVYSIDPNAPIFPALASWDPLPPPSPREGKRLRLITNLRLEQPDALPGPRSSSTFDSMAARCSSSSSTIFYSNSLIVRLEQEAENYNALTNASHREETPPGLTDDAPREKLYGGSPTQFFASSGASTAAQHAGSPAFPEHGPPSPEFTALGERFAAHFKACQELAVGHEFSAHFKACRELAIRIERPMRVEREWLENMLSETTEGVRERAVEDWECEMRSLEWYREWELFWGVLEEDPDLRHDRSCLDQWSL